MPDLASVSVSRETVEALESFSLLVQKWTIRINLISAASVPDIWNRHIIDSAQLYPLGGAGWTHWVDLGAGGGFPAIVLGIIARQDRPDARLTLVESDQRKAAFLRTAVREFRINGAVMDGRAESLPPLGADVLSARALGPLDGLLSLAKRHLKPEGCAIFPKGRSYQAEIDAAREHWSFQADTVPSVTDPESQILRIERISHV
jgi:16S rRNA (guanine527-N7)-methyltransferase